MPISYDPTSRKWSVTKERTDYQTKFEKLPEEYELLEENVTFEIDVPTNIVETVYNDKKFSQQVPDYTWNSCATKDSSGYCQGGYVNNGYKTVYTGGWETITKPGTKKETMVDYATSERNKAINAQNKENIKLNKEMNIGNEKTAQENAALNKLNTDKNLAYDTVLKVVASTKGGDYVTQRDLIRKATSFDETFKQTLENNYKAFYRTEKIKDWYSSLTTRQKRATEPPYGQLDVEYYKLNNPEVAEAWNQAVLNDDIDIVDRYGERNFYLNHYSRNRTKIPGLRANKAEELVNSEQYLEKKPSATDADYQAVRTYMLGLDPDSQADRLLKIPEIKAEWEKAKAGDSYWEGKAQDSFLDVEDPDQFLTLFRLSDRPEDKNINFKYNLNAIASGEKPTEGISALEDALNEALGKKAIVDVKKFGALRQDVLNQTIAEMKKAKAQEQQLAMFSNLGDVKEVLGINKELANSILGDTGVGGIFSFMGGKKKEEDLEKSLRNVTGVNNNVVYNWQQWFDNTLKKRYETSLELGTATGDAKKTIKIEADFAKKFINEYLAPRFNESRSMNEFVDYIDVRQEEENPFQTESLLNNLKRFANTQVKKYEAELMGTEDRRFNSEFYFNPTGDKAREKLYAQQAAEVAKDWEAAKKGNRYWQTQAYRYGVDLNDKDAFARLHYQVRGRAKNYDGAEDIFNTSKVSEKIYEDILPALKQRALKIGTVFGQFLKPEEYADVMLEGLDPSDKATWNEVLKRYDLQDFEGTLDELKEYIVEILRTENAQDIREQLKYLNEQREKPTQEKLGITYIERPEDYKPDENVKAETQLYKIFQNAGFQGTEDEFYDNFLSDVDRDEQILLTKAGKGESLEKETFDFSDPFASLSTVESFFDTEEEDDQEEVSPRTSYFKIDTDEDIPYKSKSGQSILGEFTSMFKGFG